MLNINTKLLLVKHIIIINISLFRMSTKLKSSQFLQNRLFNTQHPFIGLFMVMWHLTMELLTTKCHERATFRKLWHQRGNRSLLPAKWWPLLHMIRACRWCCHSAHFWKYLLLFCCAYTAYNKSLNDWSLGEQCILFPSHHNVSLNFVSGNIEIHRKQNSLNPSGRVIKVHLHVTPKYFFRLDKSLHLFKMHCAFFLTKSLQAAKVTKSGHHLFHDRVNKGYQGPNPFSETNFYDFSRTQIAFSRALKFTLTHTIPRSQC